MKKIKILILISVFVLFSCDKYDKKVIVCWGDSLTEAHSRGLKGKFQSFLGYNLAYPEILQKMLDGSYEVVNAGVGGENTLTIMARQGAYPMMLAHDVILFKDGERKYNLILGNNDTPAFLSSYNGNPCTPALRGWDDNSGAHINPCHLGGGRFNVKAESHFYKEDNHIQYQYNYFLDPITPIEKSDTLKAGTPIVTFAMEQLREPYCNIIFIGQNGGFNDVSELIRQIKAMVSYSRSKRFIVVSFHKPNNVLPSVSRMIEMEDSLATAFGNHFFNLRHYMCNNGMRDAGLEPTPIDKDSIAHGQVPPSLMKDGLHFTADAHRLIATLLHYKMVELGY